MLDVIRKNCKSINEITIYPSFEGVHPPSEIYLTGALIVNKFYLGRVIKKLQGIIHLIMAEVRREVLNDNDQRKKARF